MRVADHEGMKDEPQPAISNLNISQPMDSRTTRRMAFTLYAILLPVVVAGFVAQASVDVPVSSPTTPKVANSELVTIRDSRGVVVETLHLQPGEHYSVVIADRTVGTFLAAAPD